MPVLAHTLKYAPERILMYVMTGDNYSTTRTLVQRIQRKPNNRELASLCRLICKIIHVSRERLVPYYRVLHTLKSTGRREIGRYSANFADPISTEPRRPRVSSTGPI
jgi:hypothetical protein